MKQILSRKIGAFELATGVAVLELVVDSAIRGLVFGGIAALVFIGERHFEGPFSLADLHTLLKGKPK